MKKNTFLLASLILITSAFPGIAKGEDSCKTVQDCIELASELTGKKYITTVKIEGGVTSTKNLSWNKSNSDKLLSLVLNEHGYTRVFLNNNTYKVINSKDIRYTPTTTYRVQKGKKLSVPMDHDYYTLSYRALFPVVVSSITRAMRPFMSRYGRVIENPLSGTLVIQDTGVNLHRLYKLLESMDVRPNKDFLKKHKKDSK